MWAHRWVGGGHREGASTVFPPLTSGWIECQRWQQWGSKLQPGTDPPRWWTVGQAHAAATGLKSPATHPGRQNMGKAEFEQSLASGRHQALASMSGDWAGTTRVWFEPDQPPVMDVQQSGTLRSVLGGRFLLHEYRYGEGEQAGEGIALYGLHLDEDAYEAAWVDSFHTGSAIMFSTALAGGDGFKALGSY